MYLYLLGCSNEHRLYMRSIFMQFLCKQRHNTIFCQHLTYIPKSNFGFFALVMWHWIVAGLFTFEVCQIHFRTPEYHKKDYLYRNPFVRCKYFFIIPLATSSSKRDSVVLSGVKSFSFFFFAFFPLIFLLAFFGFFPLCPRSLSNASYNNTSASPK